MSKLEHRWISRCISSCFNLGLTCLPRYVKRRSRSSLSEDKKKKPLKTKNSMLWRGQQVLQNYFHTVYSRLTRLSKMNLHQKKHLLRNSSENHFWSMSNMHTRLSDVLYFHICFYIQPCIYCCVLNIKHNKPYGVFICFLAQVYGDK